MPLFSIVQSFGVGSAGTVWDPEFMQMRHTESLLFTAEQNENLEYFKSALNKDCIRLIDTLKLYETSQKNDILNISLNEIESCSYRQYEMNTLSNLLSCLDQY